MRTEELKNLFKEEPEFTTGYSRIYLYILFSGIIFLPLFGYIIKTSSPGAVENLWERYFLAGLGLVGFGIYKSPPNVSRYFSIYLRVMFYLASIWSLRVTAINNFSIDYVSGHLVVLSAVVLGYYEHLQRRIYMVVMVLLTAGWLIITPEPVMPAEVLVGNMVVLFVIFDLVLSKLRSMFLTLRFRNKLMKTLYQESTDALIVYSPKTKKIENCNAQALSLFGVKTCEELSGFNLLKYIPRELIVVSRESTIERGLVQSEARLPKARGEDFWASIAVRDIYSSEVNFILIRVSDITIRRQREEAVKASEEWLRKLIENSGDVITLLDSGARIIFNSAAFSRITGFGEGEFITSSFTRITAPEDARRVEEILGRVLEFEEVKDEEFRIVTASGEYIWIECSFINRLDDPVVKSIILNYRDTSERRKVTAMITESENRYRSLFDNSPVGILLYDKKLAVISANKKCCEIIRITHERLMGFSLAALKDSKVLSIIANTLNGIEAEYEGLYTTISTGVSLNVKLRTTPLREASGGIIAGIAIIDDISEQVRAAEELIKAKAHAEQISRLKSSFLANMSHELRTPMNGILGFAQILQEEAGTPDQKEMTESILKTGNRLMTTLNSILDLAMLESGEVIVDKKQIDLKEVVKRIADKYYNIAISQGLTLFVSSRSDKLIVLADEKLLFQVLSHLMDNAIKFTRSGGVEISMGEISAGKAAIYIQDSGIGIQQEHLELIFQDFRQVSEGYGRHFEGTGLGLSIVQRMLSLIDAQIEAESVVGQGTKFIIKLPLLSTG